MISCFRICTIFKAYMHIFLWFTIGPIYWRSRKITVKYHYLRFDILMWGHFFLSYAILPRIPLYIWQWSLRQQYVNNSYAFTYHCNDVIMSTMASLITSVLIVYSSVCSDTDQRKHQSSASLAFVWGIHRGPVNFPHKGQVTRKMFLFGEIIMTPTFDGFRQYRWYFHFTQSTEHKCEIRIMVCGLLIQHWKHYSYLILA